MFNMYEKWGTIKHVPHVSIGEHTGEQSGAHPLHFMLLV